MNFHLEIPKSQYVFYITSNEYVLLQNTKNVHKY